ncbi:hypothetical protein J0H58_24775 [bacterium]|nr:hypothetical protein [bacterium]
MSQGGELGRDHTQQSRSFLFVVLTTVTARTFGRWRARLYENGVTSLNPAISPQVGGLDRRRFPHPSRLRVGCHVRLPCGAPLDAGA